MSSNLFENNVIYKLFAYKFIYDLVLNNPQAQSAGAVEYANCISAESKTPPANKSPAYDIKQSDGEAPVMLEVWGMQSTSPLPWERYESNYSPSSYG